MEIADLSRTVFIPALYLEGGLPFKARRAPPPYCAFLAMAVVSFVVVCVALKKCRRGNLQESEVLTMQVTKPQINTSDTHLTKQGRGHVLISFDWIQKEKNRKV